MGQVTSEYSGFTKWTNHDGVSVYYDSKGKMYDESEMEIRFSDPDKNPLRLLTIKDCSSCQNGDKEFPDQAAYKLIKAPREVRETHGIYLCQDHMDLVDGDWGLSVQAEKLK